MTLLSTTLRESMYLDCAADDAHRYLMERLARTGGVEPTILLRVPVADLSIDREVVVSLDDLPSKAGDYVMEITWSAKGGGPYPIFIGSLACLRASGAGAHLEIEGTYTIPGGSLGKAFDAAIGHRIGVAAAHSMLQALQSVVNAACERERDLLATLGIPASYPPTYE